MRLTVFLACMTLAILACGGDKKADTSGDEKTVECESNADCEDGLVCLDSECADPSVKAHFTDPSRAVTPQKVKREVDKRTEEHRKRIDKSLDIQ